MKNRIQYNRKFLPATIAAVAKLRESKPWAGTFAERLVKFQTLHADLCAAYGVSFEFSAVEGGSSFTTESNVLTMRGLSLVNYLYGFKAIQLALSGQADSVQQWATTLYVRMFPADAVRMVACGGYILKPERATELGLVGVPMTAIIAEAKLRDGFTAADSDPETCEVEAAPAAPVAQVADAGTPAPESTATGTEASAEDDGAGEGEELD